MVVSQSIVGALSDAQPTDPITTPTTNMDESVRMGPPLRGSSRTIDGCVCGFVKVDVDVTSRNVPSREPEREGEG